MELAVSKKLKISEEEQAVLDKYDSTGIWFGNPDFFKYWKALRNERYCERKNAGLPDPLDILNNMQIPIYTKKDPDGKT